jgi:tight adherence protein B
MRELSTGAWLQMTLIASLSFVSVALLVQLALSAWRRHRATGARRLRERIQKASSASLGDEGAAAPSSALSQDLLRHLDGLLQQLGLAEPMSLMMSQAGLALRPAQLVVKSVIWAIAVLAACIVAQLGTVVSLVLAGCAGFVPWVCLERRRATRLRTLENQLPEVLEVISRALRAGYSFAGALKVVGEEMPEPIGPEFARTQDEISFGIPVKDALNNLLARVPSDNLRYMVVATVVQRETGGNLADIFSKIARLMRERISLQGQIRVLSADGRVSVMILCLLPILGGVGMFFMNRPYIARLWETADGRFLLMLSAGMMTAGVLWMRSIVQIKV